MRKSILGMVFMMAAMVFAGVAMAGEMPETLTIDDCSAKKSAVEFPHAAHLEVTECTTCHHTAEGLTAETAGSMEVKSCASCHLEPAEETTPGCSEMSLKKNPFHINCVGCHKEQAAGPTKCDECHPKAE